MGARTVRDRKVVAIWLLQSSLLLNNAGREAPGIRRLWAGITVQVFTEPNEAMKWLESVEEKEWVGAPSASGPSGRPFTEAALLAMN